MTEQDKTVLHRIASTLSILTLAFCSFGGYASANSISTTGQGSENTITNSATNRCVVTNTNDVAVSNENDQDATSGDATVDASTAAGGAVTGDAENENNVDGEIIVDNSTACCAMPATSVASASTNTIDTTGQGSENTIENTVTNTTVVTNTNDVAVSNENDQDATSGDATVDASTAAGGAVTGDASNTNDTSFIVELVNGSASSTNSPSVAHSGCGQPSGGFGGGNGSGFFYGPASFTPAGTAAVGGFGGGSFGGGFGSGGTYTTRVRTASAPRNNAPVHHSVAPTSHSAVPTPTHSVGGSGSGNAGVQASSISNTGQGSENTITHTTTNSYTVNNSNTVVVNNSNTQTSTSGNATTTSSTDAGGSTTGTASNENSAHTHASVEN